MEPHRTTRKALLAPAALLALAAVAPMVLAGEAAKFSPSRSAGLVATEQPDSIVGCVSQAARQLFKPQVLCADSPVILHDADKPISVEFVSTFNTSFDPLSVLSPALTDLPPPAL